MNFPFGSRPIFRCELLLVSGRVTGYDFIPDIYSIHDQGEAGHCSKNINKSFELRKVGDFPIRPAPSIIPSVFLEENVSNYISGDLVPNAPNVWSIYPHLYNIHLSHSCIGKYIYKLSIWALYIATFMV